MDICSYCQREYGSKGYKGLILEKTIDHLTPKDNKRRHGGYRNNIRLSHLYNLLICCQECNQLKGNNNVLQFEQLLLHIKPNKNLCSKYLDENIIRTILRSIKVIKQNKTVPFELSYLIN